MNNWKLVSDFLVTFWGNDLYEPAVRRLLENNYSRRPDHLKRVLEAGQKVLESHDYDIYLQHTIAWSVNVVLDNDTPEGAREWLTEKLNLLEEIIGG